MVKFQDKTSATRSDSSNGFETNFVTESICFFTKRTLSILLNLLFPLVSSNSPFSTSQSEILPLKTIARWTRIAEKFAAISFIQISDQKHPKRLSLVNLFCCQSQRISWTLPFLIGTFRSTAHKLSAEVANFQGHAVSVKTFVCLLWTLRIVYILECAAFFVHFVATVHVLHGYNVKLPSHTFYWGNVVCLPVRFFFSPQSANFYLGGRCNILIFFFFVSFGFFYLSL